MSPQQIRQHGVVLVAASPGMALAAFVAGMTLPLFDVARAFIAAEGVVSVAGGMGAGLVLARTSEALVAVKPLRVWMMVNVVAGTTALLTLYTDHPEKTGLLTSLSSVVFTVAVLASVLGTFYVLHQAEQGIKSWGLALPELPR
ncbi:hypothetical protein ACSHWB_23340 [Lentzea sp. HUAS TT2]|uniref:hypothetical protein n=1 Tax=Lentzea sp. HUAS TT2 TaxID=3447454 RepID=UPI003F6F3DEF